jgi:o-succinylbenzoate---CoA ligase
MALAANTEGQFPDWLRRRAFSNPDRLAVIAGNRQLTFAELDRRVDLAARRLAHLGVGSGDRVAVLLPNSVAFVTLIHAISRLGAISVPVNLRLTPGEIAWQLHDVQASMLIADQPSEDLLATLNEQCAALKVVEVQGAAEENLSGRPNTAEESVQDNSQMLEYHAAADIHSIVYTSGTTGRPKGAILTYGNHWWSAIGSSLNLGNHPDDRWIAVLPLFHVGGLSILLRSVIYGITVVVHESFDPEEVNRSIVEDRVTIISVVSTMLRRMLEAQGERSYPEWLRCVLLGGGPAPRPLLEDCAARGVPVTQTYGLTETGSQIATLAPEDALRKLGSAGKPLYPNELAIEADGQLAEPGEPGEILVRGPIVTAGYFNRSDATEEAMRGGWFRTGDAGYLDEDGYLYVLDRRDDLIVSGGENVYPAEVEAVLSGHPEVVEAGVIGIPDDEWGQRVVAVVSTQNGTLPGLHELDAYCRQYLAGYKVPTRFHVHEGPLPRNAGGKLLRRILRQSFIGA